MEKYTLSLPQKLLTGCSVFIFVLGLIIILGISVNAYQEANRPIRLASHSYFPSSEAGTELSQGAYFDELVYQSSGYSQLSWGNNSIFLMSGSSARISEDKVTIVSGSAFLILSGRTQLVFRDKLLPVQTVAGLFDSNQNRFILLAGEVQVSEQEKALVNNLILHDGQKFTTANFDRGELTQNPLWSELIMILSERRFLPDSLSDTIPPSLVLDSLGKGAEVTEALLTVTGRSEPGVRITVNSLEANVDGSGAFKKELILEPGNNRIIIEAIDPAGNIASENIVVTFTKEQPQVPPAVPVSISTQCTESELKLQLFCIVNEIRQANSLSSLSDLNALDIAAQARTNWMATNLNLSYVETDGKTVLDRCQSVNITCIGETVGYSANLDAIQLMSRWMADSTTSSLILGNSANIGYGETNGYVSLVFN